MANNGIVSVVRERKEEVLDLISQGKPLTEIADYLGLSTPSAITERIAEDPDYRAAMATSAWVKMQKREKELEEADSNVHVTRADRLLGHARWLGERLARSVLGQAVAVTGSDGGPLQVQIVRFGRVIEGESYPQADVPVLPNKEAK